jgi:hypothetical protein
MTMLGLSSNVRIAHLPEILPFALNTSLRTVRLCKEDHACLTYLMLQRQLSHLNGRKLGNRQV